MDQRNAHLLERHIQLIEGQQAEQAQQAQQG